MTSILRAEGKHCIMENGMLHNSSEEYELVNSAFGFDGQGIQYELENTPLASRISNSRNI